MPIRQNLKPAIRIGPVDSRAALQPFEKFRARMAVRVFFTRGNDGDLRSHGVQELRHSRMVAAMVTDLQHIRVQEHRVVFPQHLILHLFLRLAWQQNRAVAVGQAHYQRIHIFRLRRDFIRRNLRP